MTYPIPTSLMLFVSKAFDRKERRQQGNCAASRRHYKPNYMIESRCYSELPGEVHERSSSFDSHNDDFNANHAPCHARASAIMALDVVQTLYTEVVSCIVVIHPRSNLL